jgi:hypothetical protein
VSKRRIYWLILDCFASLQSILARATLTRKSYLHLYAGILWQRDVQIMMVCHWKMPAVTVYLCNLGVNYCLALCMLVFAGRIANLRTSAHLSQVFQLLCAC